ncbi:ATP-dependent protease ATPase subunit HslU [Parasphaerochaeta coccoides]|uniref:Heat shock protein HslVU, ATPase subunit HslU n=1 Tax=Parasphaerochaeta coccoides (strain ATCC BAA-1237 / DSM 17374 / SPN1) TaxID=760011 RepID=F4GKV8_PARC1|nr:ATP-dependent protease ATPase subunit HslU [Parasphaerochaeta coccoides]AEC01871.1 heat shock protein HslVU, ATPase subunit HslU [Parasphaerochaeta coccoides DSM 17374]
MDNKIHMLDDMTPAMIVSELDKYIIGQTDAKKTIAVAIRSRSRRKKLPEALRDEIAPRNIIMIGPTGVGKTEIARRISRLANAPFVKVEATKFTEIGYVGRDVESMVRDLMGIAVQMVHKELGDQQEDMVRQRVEDRLLDLLIPAAHQEPMTVFRDGKPVPMDSVRIPQSGSSDQSLREQIRAQLRAGSLDETVVDFSVSPKKPTVGIDMMGMGNMEDLQQAMNSLGSIFNNRSATHKKLSVKRAREILTEEELEKIVDQDKVVEIAKERTEQMGIIFIDEIDKVAGNAGKGSGPDVSREGVQRDLLPIVEGTKVSTKWGVIDTTHILFIAAGAFHVSKPSDLIPELQGRFPLRTELSDLTADDFYRILQEPENAIIKQYCAMLETEGVKVVFSDDALRRISVLAYEVNSTSENIGARRLYTVMEKLLEEVSFTASDLSGQTIPITPAYVDERLGKIIQNPDLSRYIL